MQPQFVDFNGDGHIDIVTATFDGSPWVSYGSEEGFGKPQHILNSEGNRIILARWWDYDNRKWTTTDHTDGKATSAHAISVVAFDWNGNGAFDLLMGDRAGKLFLVMNEGTNAEPKYATTAKPVMVGDKMFDAGGKITAPRMVDWDKDGVTDMVIGTFGDTWGTGEGGGVLLFRNTGKKGAPVFDKPTVLIENSKKDATEATRPDAGLYVDVVDWNGNGKWDLVVGGYSLWKDSEAKADEGGKTAAGRANRPNRKPAIWVYVQKVDKEKADDKAPEKPIER